MLESVLFARDNLLKSVSQTFAQRPLTALLRME